MDEGRVGEREGRREGGRGGGRGGREGGGREGGEGWKGEGRKQGKSNMPTYGSMDGQIEDTDLHVKICSLRARTHAHTIFVHNL